MIKIIIHITASAILVAMSAVSQSITWLEDKTGPLQVSYKPASNQSKLATFQEDHLVAECVCHIASSC